MFIPAGLWILILAVQVLVSLVAVGRGVPAVWYVLWNLAATAFLAFAVFRGTYETVGGAVNISGSADLGFWAAFFAVLAGIHAAAAAWYLPGANGLLRYVDVLAVSAVLWLWISSQVMPGEYISPLIAAAAAMILDLLAVNQIRTREEGEEVIYGSGTGGKLALAAVALVIFLVTAVCIGAASGQINSAVDVLLVILKFAGRLLTWILGIFTLIIAAVLVFGMMLLPGKLSPLEERMTENLGESAAELTGGQWLHFPPWFWPAAGAAALVICLAVTLVKLRGIKLKRPADSRPAARVVRKNKAWEAIRLFLLRLAQRIAGEVRYFSNRNTAAGLFIYAQRMGAGHGSPRRASEGPGEYLRRLAATGGPRPKESSDASPGGGMETPAAALLRLAETMDRIYYGGSTDDLFPPACREYRLEIRRYFENQNVNTYLKK